MFVNEIMFSSPSSGDKLLAKKSKKKLNGRKEKVLVSF